jgi:hypothetical protein
MSDRSSPAQSHAVVIGASIAWLLAARALSRSFDRVTVFERDALQESPTPLRAADCLKVIRCPAQAGARRDPNPSAAELPGTSAVR